jgi:hypothetical protein
MRRIATCPHCGNNDPATIEDNGCKPSNPAYTLLCVKPCAHEDSTFDFLPEGDEQALICGMQWEPHDELPPHGWAKPIELLGLE